MGALVRERWVSAVVDGDNVSVELPGGELRAAVRPDVAVRWLQPADIVGPLTLGGEPVTDPRDIVRAAELSGPKTRVRELERLVRSAAVHSGERWRAAAQVPVATAAAHAGFAGVRVTDPFDSARDARIGWTPKQTRAYDAAFGGTVELLRVAVPARSVTVSGRWSSVVRRWLGEAREGEVVVPVHPGATESVRAAHPTCRVLDGARSATVRGPAARVQPAGFAHAVWLSLPVAAGPTAATACDAVMLGPAVRGLARGGLGVVAELGAVASDNGSVAAVVQEVPEAIWPSGLGVPALALEQLDPDGAPWVRSLLGAQSAEAWFSAWSGRLLDVVMPLLEQGVAVPLDPTHWSVQLGRGRPVGVVVDGWWRARAHLPTCRLHTELANLEGCEVDDLETLFRDAFDVVVARHLGHVARLLELGPGAMRMVRDHVDRIVLPGSRLHDAWTGWVVPHRCSLRTRITGRPEWRDLPNPIA